MDLIQRDSGVLVLVDLQERLVPAIHDGGGVVHAARSLADACRILGVPVVVTEHCPNRIGHTVAALAEARAAAEIITKTHFSALAEESGRETFARIGRRQPIVCGTEAHVCVLQTAAGLRQAGYAPVVVADAVGSRKPADRDAGLARLRDGGIAVVTAEMVLFELLGRAETDEFRRVLPLIKGLDRAPPG